jgi:hypothetical protein
MVRHTLLYTFGMNGSDQWFTHKLK